VSYSYSEPVQRQEVEAEDQFLVDLLRASEDESEEDAELTDALQLFDDVDQIKKETAQETSVIRRYATALALKALLLYGSCKTYVKQWTASLASYLWG
jgi:molecular chaperone GrpE (heat shock protein)